MCEASERIDYEKLKAQERIAFYADIILFEDELADNGAAILSVKIVSLISRAWHGDSICLMISFIRTESNGQRVLHPAEVLSESGWCAG